MVPPPFRFWFPILFPPPFVLLCTLVCALFGRHFTFCLRHAGNIGDEIAEVSRKCQILFAFIKPRECRQNAGDSARSRSSPHALRSKSMLWRRCSFRHAASM